ncbi:uncharacterized protein [Asterias amurensis]|uniref:uncharacterized protein isoform X2 n=1 Tax=Asterias amurensis TaxID=7602 RepID=UPI003AB1C730
MVIEGCRRRRRRTDVPPPAPDYPPTFTNCSNYYITSTQASGQRVLYTIPPAADDKCCWVVSRIWGLPSGSYFPEGNSSVSFQVRDTIGQKAHCSFTITVKVYRCPAVSHSPYRWHRCTNNNFIGSSCHFHCSLGYSISGSSTSICYGYGYWSPKFPTCQVKTCSPALQNIPHGGVTCTNSNHYNSICTYQCSTGYGFPSGSTTWRVCGETWSGTTPTCVDIQAPTFSFCPVSFSRTADDVQTSAIVAWSTPTATDNVPGGLTVSQILGSPSGSQLSQGLYSIKYQATDGRGNVGYCSFTVTVIVITCGGLTHSEGLLITCPNNHIKGASCTFVCALGYQLVGIGNTITCQSDRTWSPSQPSCQILTCPTLDPPTNGNFQNGGSCSNTYASLCYFECDTGFSITGSSARHCMVQGVDQSDATWSGTSTGCQPSTCPIPSSTMLYPEESNTCPAVNPLPYNSICSFNCPEGYAIQGGSSSTCGVENQWEQTLPQCQEITCYNSDLPVPNNGMKSGCSGDYELYGTMCTLSCNRGYSPTSEVQRTCQSNGVSGVWSGGTISCTAVVCPPLSMPANGIVSHCVRNGQDRLTTGTQLFDTTCTFVCNEGYTIFGTGSRNCLVSGIWDGSSVQCNDETPPLVQCPVNQVIFAGIGQIMVSLSWSWEPVTGTDAGQTIFASLHTFNSDPVNGTRPTTLIEGTHSLVYVATDSAGNSGFCSMQVEAKVTRCYGLSAPENGMIDLVSGNGSCIESAVYGSRCAVSCEAGHTLSTEGTTLVRQCDRLSEQSTVGFWTQNPPSCNVNLCSFPNISNGYIAGCNGDSASYEDSCEFRCGQGQRTPSGQTFRVRQCQADTSWNGSDFQCTVTVTCPGPFSITHGSIEPATCSQASMLPYNTECVFSCNNGFIQQGPSSKTCTDDGSWDNPQTTLCIDQQKPSFEDSCPKWITVTSAFGSTFQVVDFDVPTSTDNSGNVTVRRQSGHMAPGSVFPEGRTTVTYIATDPTGNSQLCDVFITVEVYRCGRLEAPGSGSVLCNHTAHIVGTQCVLECNTGYTMGGSDIRTCQLNGDNTPYWDGQSTVCTISSCPSQSIPANAFKSGCSNSPDAFETYGTECSFYCMIGYQEETSDGGRSRCLEDGTWSGTDLVCTETQCPILSPSSGVTLIPTSCFSQAVYGDNCLLSCVKSGFKVVSPGSDHVTCFGNGQWSQNISSVQCVDDQDPQFTNCPAPQTFYALNGSSSAEVTWFISATDNDDLPPTITCDAVSGDQFVIGLHWVVCTAQDAAGNTAGCNFNFDVQQRRCPFLSPPHFGDFVVDCSIVHGSVCQIHCLDGYVLQGSDQATCEFDGSNTYWQRDETPSCNFVTCDALSLPSDVQVNPAYCAYSRLTIGSRCSFSCLNGLSLSNDVSSVVCEDDGTWSAEMSDLPTHCEDGIAPTLSVCPGPTQATLENENTVSVTFDVPTATDNLPSSALTLVTYPADVTSPYLFNETTDVTYTFTDQAGNSATCVFRVSIFDELKPRIVFCPSAGYDITGPQQTEVTWQTPVFEDLRGDHLQITQSRGTGNSDRFSWGTHNVVYTASDIDNGQIAVCEFTITLNPVECSSLDVPGNGTLACDLWQNGKFCTMFCNAKFDIPRRQNGEEVRTQYVCGLSGMWTPSSKVPDCSETKRSTTGRLPSELMYFSGDCSNQSTQDSIAQAFIDLLRKANFTELCVPIEKCTIDNVEVTCGESSRRRRSYQEDGYQQQRRLQRSEAKGSTLRSMELQLSKPDEQAHNKQRREALTSKVFIYFDVGINIQHSEGVDSFDATIDAEDKMIVIVDGLSTKLGDGTLPLVVPEVEMQYDETSYGYAEIDCEPGYIADNDNYVCVACTTGYMFNNLTNDCQSCPRGCYQDQQAQLSCFDCPPGTTTATSGANNKTLCKESCPVGQYSDTGTIPCFKCAFGEFQPEPGQTSCLPCPDGTTCQDYGSQSMDQCLEICSPGSVSDTGLFPCTLCDRRSYQPNSQQRHCLLCPGSNTTINNGSTSLEQCVYIDECKSSPCSDESTCIDLIDGFRCDCQPGYEGDRCQFDIDECLHHRCANNATCDNQINHYQCLCVTGFQGEFCDENIDECDSSPCLNDGVCLDQVNGYDCQCASNYTGINCEIPSCIPNPCENGGYCRAEGGDYVCLCAPGYNGINCSISINECDSSPCQNGGTCRDLLNAFSCECPAGFNGTRCEIDVDLCASSPCHETSTCVDQVSIFRCVCPADRAGDLCYKVRTACDDAPCQNNATCVSSELNEYNCACVAGYSGLNCEVDFNECASAPCSNGGTCIEPELNSFMCDCLPGFQGDTCTVDIDECSSNPCGAMNTCEDEINGYFCQCEVGLTGDHCEETIDYCAELSLCMNGATCSNTGTGYQCSCIPGYIGLNCELDIDECISVPCQHSGACIDQVNGYLCDCVEGFTGSHCDMNMDDCYPGLCENSGTCFDGIASYTCECSAGFTGTHCEEPIDYCDGNPCQNGGVCISQHLGYSCMCQEGYIGQNCEENFDECSSYPCIYASSCEDDVNAYACICDVGYNGVNCEHEINECDSNPCMNDGRCCDYINRFVCRCLEGFTGTLCDDNIDDCLEEPCFNGGSCLDETNSFSCVCSEGFTGDLCDVNIDECESTPCMNGAACQDGLSAYECECLPGYSGDDCDVNINECLLNNADCMHGGSCIDKVADFECSCHAGYRGRFCDEEINECDSDPCENGGSCTDEEAKFSCDCAIGFTGARCEIEVDLCVEVPCSNGATCTSRPGAFNCSCPPGFSGDLCDTDVNECVSQPCLNQATCEDRINGYQCVCLPGYTGVHCETELSADFDLKFFNTSKADLVHVTNLTSYDLTDLSASLWMRSVSCHGDFILWMISTNGNPVLKVHDPSDLKLTIMGSETVIEMSTMLCDGRWHSVLVTWQGTSQEWKVYIDQTLASEGAVNETTVTLQRGLMLTIGPDGSEEDFYSFELDLSSVNIWSIAWNESQVPDIVSSCRTSLPADVFAWSQLAITPSDAVTQTLRAPSTCDDIDECSSDPCTAGQCEDQLSMFTCHCPEGLEGDRCQNMTDYCLEDVCLNNATCQSEAVGYLCVCPVGFNGSQCQIQIIDGGWGPWTPYSNCTEPCDGGTQTRSRVCDNPLPENGGQPCSGEATEEKACNTETCPACSKLRRPYRGTTHCMEKADKEINCTISCKDGYTFGMSTLSFYHCGPSSSYRWPHQNEDNPLARLPQCVEAKPVEAFTAMMSCDFNSVSCSSEADMATVKESTHSSLSKQPSLSCVNDKTCTAEVSVGNCNHGGRGVRQAVSGIQLTVTVFINLTETGNATGNGTENGGQALVESVSGLVTVVEAGEFELEIDGEVKSPDLSSIVTDAFNTCPEGTAQTDDGFCVRCGEGTFLFQSSENEFDCLPCPVGTYQDQEGQSSCTNCPHEMVTYGKGASNITECFAVCEKGSYRVWSDVIGDNRCDFCPENTFSNETGMEYCIDCPDGMITNGTGAVSSTDCYDLPTNTTTTMTTTAPTTTERLITAPPVAHGFNIIFVIIGIAGLFALIIASILLCLLLKKLTVKNEVSQSPEPDRLLTAYEMQPGPSNPYILDERGQSPPSCSPPPYEAFVVEKPELPPEYNTEQSWLTPTQALSKENQHMDT